MENNQEKINILGANLHKDKVHKILAHSYLVYFLFFIIGIFLDLVFKIKISNFSFSAPVGVFLIILATLLIFWAQNTSRNLEKENITKETFCKGPYGFTRSPTHWGLFLLILGFGITINAFFVIIFAVISFLVTRFIYLRKEEEILEKKYGTPYAEYKKIVQL